MVNHAAGGACHFSGIHTLALVHSTFVLNRAKQFGGATYIKRVAKALIRNCTFEKNTATFGGAVHVSEANQNTNSFMLLNCSFRHNIGMFSAGALLLNNTGINISHCDFSSNVGQFGSAVGCEGKMSTMNVELSKFCNNSYETQMDSKASGSAIYVRTALHVLLVDVSFVQNHDGGGIIVGNTSAKIQNCLFYKNTGNSGGAVSVISFGGKLLIDNCSFVENSALVGSVVHLANKITVIQNSYFRNNWASVVEVVIASDAEQYSEIRFCNDTFIENDESYDSQRRSLVLLGLAGGTLYFWETYQMFKSNKTLSVDKILMENASVPQIVVPVSEGINSTQVVSQFASGKH